MSPEEILKKAIQLEKDAIETYRSFKSDADPETAEILDYLIAQEREHIRILHERLKVVRLLKK
ncbi:ferritin family protein [Archaeoglobus neptunius]|uniref:ferritin family protein n=1 Tax=Archaeoglobus neptunius TaxID=2798580 RepID=UPI001926C545|nr:ferritin family protein [Archaeoglobus neptunius]